MVALNAKTNLKNFAGNAALARCRFFPDFARKAPGVLDADGTHVIRYIYDAYGNVMTKQSWSDQAGVPVASFQNPFLYNGYYYDAET